jgi:LysM repeat protein
VGDTVDGMSQLTGNSIEEILRLNSLKDPFDLKPGIRIMLPCYEATYRMEQWDTFNEIGKNFGYYDAKGLAEANGLLDPEHLDSGTDLKLPDWRFFYAREHDTLEAIDNLFGLPKGSTITVGRVYHPDPRLPYAGETVAVPTTLFSDRLRKGQRRKKAKRRRLRLK